MGPSRGETSAEPAAVPSCVPCPRPSLALLQTSSESVLSTRVPFWGGSEPREHNPTRFGTGTGPRKHPRDRTWSWISCQAGGVEGPIPGVGEVPAWRSSAMAEDVTGVVWVTRREKERCIRHAASLKFRGTGGAGAENVAQRATVRSPEAAQRCRRVRGGEWHRLGGIDRQLEVRVEVRGPRRPRFRDLRRLRLAGGLS